MPIHIDVLTRLNERKLKQDTDRLAHDFDRAGVAAGDKFGTGLERSLGRSSPKIQRAFHRVTDATTAADRAMKSYNDEVARSGASSDKAIAASERFATARRREADAHRSVAAALRDSNRDIDRARDAAGNFTTIIQEMGTAAFKTGRGLATLGAPIAIGGLIELGQVAAHAAKSVFLLPAAATAAAAGMGTLALATAGFGDAIKEIRDPEKFATALQSLAPSAQQAALSIQALLPEFDKLKNATQDAFFAGIGPELEKLSSTYLPKIQQMTTSIADSFNQMMRGVGEQLMTPENQTQIQGLMDNIATAFQNLTPAAQSVSQAFLDIAAAGGDFLPGMASGVADLAAQFANFIREARDSGELKVWIQEGIDAVSALATELGKLTALIYQTFTDEGPKSIQDFRTHLEGLTTVMQALNGNMKPLADELSSELAEIPKMAETGFIHLANVGVHTINALIRTANLLPGIHIDTMDTFNVGDFGWGNPAVPGAPGLPVGNGPHRRPGTPPMVGPPTPGTRPVPAPPPPKGPKPPLNIPREQFALSSIPIGQFPGAGGTGGPAGPMMGSGGAYGLPAGSDVRQGAAGFPDWVYALGQQYGLTASTYAGHQESNRGDIGALPNPQGQNRGIDWWGSPQNMQAFADALVQSGIAEQVIFQNPVTGQQTGFPANVNYAGDYGGHTGHVHTRFGQAPGGPMDTAGGTGGPMAAAGGGGWTPPDPGRIRDLQDRIANAEGNVEDKRLRVLELRADNNSDQNDIAKAEREVQEAERAYLNAQADLTEEQRGTYERATNTSRQFTEGMQQIGVALDQDLGISKGLPGLAENLVKFLANLAAAPVLGALTGVTQAYGTAGPGTGLLGALQPRQNVFGQAMPNALGQYDPAMLQQQMTTGGPTGQSAYSSTGLGMGGPGVGQAGPGGTQSGRDWDTVAQYESGGDWHINTGNGFFGGLQFQQSSWDMVKGPGDPARADLATREQQIAAAEKLFAIQGWQAWPNTTRTRGVAGFRAGGGVDSVPAMLTPGEHVLTRRDVKALGGQRGVYGMRRSLHMDGGGGVPPGPKTIEDFMKTLPWEPRTMEDLMLGPPAGQSLQQNAPPLPLSGLPGGPPSGPQPGGLVPGALAGQPVRPPGQGSNLPQQPRGDTPHLGRYPGQGLNLPKGGGITLSGGGILGLAQQAAPMALQAAGAAGGAMGGGAGGALASAAAQIGIDQINRAIQYGSQVAGIAVSGLMETFLPNESPLADIGGGWLGRIAGAVAGTGSSAALNLAGLAGGAPGTGEQGMGGQLGKTPGPLTPEAVTANQRAQTGGIGASLYKQPVTVNYTNNRATEDRAGRDLTHHLNLMNGPRGRHPGP